MTDFYLRATSETALQAALQSAGLYNDETGYILASMSHGLDIVGIVIKPGTYDESGNELTPPIVRPGYHANLRLLEGELHTALTDLVIPTPKTPSVMWA